MRTSTSDNDWDQTEQGTNLRTKTDYKCPYNIVVCLFGGDKKCFIIILEAA
jgi:hypothetical protein